MLVLILLILLTMIFVIFFISSYEVKILKDIGLSFSIFIFFLSLVLLFKFDANVIGFQELFYVKLNILNLNLNYTIGVDGISLFFVILTTFFNTNLYTKQLEFYSV